MLAAGVPVSERKEVSGSAARWAQMATDDYQELRQRYLRSSTLLPQEVRA
jgi:carbonic anhydrase/acetyltransferase-like protein (isoleucine patch superfamily)